MSLVGEFANKPLEEDNLGRETDQVPCKEEDVNRKDRPQADKRTSNPLRLLKDDLFKVFRDKPEDRKSANVKKEKMVKHLSLLEDDLSRFKDELSNVFRFGLSMEKDRKEDSRIKAVLAEGTNKPKKGQHLDSCSIGHLQESKVETLKTERVNNNIKDRKNPAKDCELDLKETREKSEPCFCKTQLSEELMASRNPGGPTEFFNNLFRREKNCVKPSEDVKLLKKKQLENRLSGSKEEQVETLSEPNRDRVNQPEDGSPGVIVSVTETMGSLDPAGTTVYYNDQKNTESSQTVEDPAQEIQELEINLKDDYFSNHRPQDNGSKVKDQREKREDKDWNVEHKDPSSSHIKNKANISALSLLKDDVGFSFSLSKDKAAKAADPKPSQTNDSSFSRLSLLKDDLSNVFRFSLSNEKDKDEASKMKETDDSLKNLFKRDQNVFATSVANKGEVKAMLLEKKEELDCSFRQNLSDHEEKLNTEGISNNKDEDSALGQKWSVEKSETCFSETQKSDKMRGTSDTGRSIGFFKNLFRRDQNPPEVEDNQQAKNTFLEKKEEQRDWPEDREPDPNVSEKESETSLSETHQRQENTSRIRNRGFGETESTSAVVVKQLSQENNCREAEVLLTERDEDLEDLEVHKDNDLRMNEALHTTQSLKTRPLALLKEDLRNVFKVNLTVENKEGASQGQVLNVPKQEDLLRRDTKLDISERADLSQQSTETFNTETIKIIKETSHQPDGSKPDIKPQSMSSETKTHKEMMVPTRTVRFSADDDDIIAKRDQAPGIHLWESFGIKLPGLTHGDSDTMRVQPGGDEWSLKNFASYLTLDPNTANSELHLSDGNRKATRVWSDHPPLDHPDRFMHCPQVLCREGLLDSVYWEVEWSGGADIGIAYNNISRDGDAQSCLLGHNERSWSLECSEGSYTACYNNVRFRSFSPELFTHRVGVHLDWSAGTLSFYCVSQDTMTHLHTFTSTFTEPLYAGFWIWAYEGSVSLCQVKLDWERLQ